MFRSLTIRAKLIGAFAILIVLAIGQGIFAQFGIVTVNHDLDHVHDHTVPSLRWSGALGAATSDARGIVLRHLLASEAAGKREVEAELESKQKEIAEARSQFEKLISSAEERTIYEEFSRHWDTYKREAAVVIEHSRKSEEDSARNHYAHKARQAGIAADSALDKLVQANIADSDKSPMPAPNAR